MEIIACEICTLSNIFDLYFYKDDHNKKIKFLCQFHYDKKIKESKDKKLVENNFKKIVTQENIKKRSFIDPMLVKIPNSLEDINLLDDCDMGVIYKNEKLLESVDSITQRFLNKIKDRYSSEEDYYDIYKPLIFSELNYVRQTYLKKQEYPVDLELDKEKDELFIIINNSFKEINLNIGKRVYFCQGQNNYEIMLNKNDDDDDDDYEVSADPIEFLGLVDYIITGEYNKKIIILPIVKKPSIIKNNLGLYYMRENYCQIPYYRMLKGLDYFHNDSEYSKNHISNLIFNQILGIGDQDNIKKLDKMEMKNIFNDKELITNIDNYGELNTQQRKCLKRIFEHSLNMIQGPPGTGKTLLASFIIYNIFKKRKDKQDKILVCAPSNSAADNLAISLLKIIKALEKNDENNNVKNKSNKNKKMRILRIYPKIRELLNKTNNNELEEISLHNILEVEIKKYKLMKLNEIYLEEEEENEMDNLINFLQDNFIKENNLKSKNIKNNINQNEKKYTKDFIEKSKNLEEIKIIKRF